MKKVIWISLIVVMTFMLSSIAMAKPKQTPPGQQGIVVNGTVINACYQKINGQLRIVSATSQCLPSELPISWNVVGPQGPSGVVATYTVSGPVGAIAGNAAAWVFAGPTVSAPTTATQHITGVAQAPLGTTADGIATFKYDLCYRAASTSDPLVSFADVNSSAGELTNTLGGIPFPVAGSVVPGSGTWEVGYCLFNSGSLGLDNNDMVNGWIIVTE